MNILDLLNEEIYGNTATVYHRASDPKTAEYILSGKWKNGKEGTYYGTGVYCVYDLNTTLADASHNTGMINKKDVYGNLIFKFRIKDINNFFIFNYDIYKKLNPRTNSVDKEGLDLGNKYSEGEEISFIDEQRKKFGIKSEVPDAKSFTYHNDAENNMWEPPKKWVNSDGFEDVRKKVAGIIYKGRGDGPTCLLAFRPTSLIPISYTDDEGKTWKKIEGVSKEYKQNASKENQKDLYSGKAAEEDKKQSLENGQYQDIEMKDKPGTHMPTLKGIINRNINITSSNVKELGNIKEVKGTLSITGCSNITNLFTIPPAKKLVITDCPIVSLQGLTGKKYETIVLQDCKDLISLRGCPKRLYHFEVINCSQLKSLRGGPEIVEENYVAESNNNLIKSIKGCPKVVRRNFDIANLQGLTQLEPAFMPKYVGGTINFPQKFSTKAVEDYLKHKGKNSGSADYADDSSYNGNMYFYDYEDDDDNEHENYKKRVASAKDLSTRGSFMDRNGIVRDKKGKRLTDNKQISDNRKYYDRTYRHVKDIEREDKKAGSSLGFKNRHEESQLRTEVEKARNKLIYQLYSENKSKLDKYGVRNINFDFRKGGELSKYFSSIYPSQASYNRNFNGKNCEFTMYLAEKNGEFSPTNIRKAKGYTLGIDIPGEGDGELNPDEYPEGTKEISDIILDMMWEFPKRFLKENRLLIQKLRASTYDSGYRGRNNTNVKSRISGKSLYEALGL